MADDKILRCDCGYRLRAETGEHRVTEVRRHAWDAHGVTFSTDDARAVLLRLDAAMAKDTTGGKEQG